MLNYIKNIGKFASFSFVRLFCYDEKRGFDPEIASMAAMLHDFHTYKAGSYDDHAHKGADLAREILGELILTEDVEPWLICLGAVEK